MLMLGTYSLDIFTSTGVVACKSDDSSSIPSKRLALPLPAELAYSIYRAKVGDIKLRLTLYLVSP